MAAKQTEKLVKIRDSALFASRSLGYKKLKDLQLGVIKSFAGGKDVFAILPTGYEKSLCYASLPILVLLDHLHEQQHATIVIVVTPLTAIMEEQVRPSITIAKVKKQYNYSGCQFIISAS